MKKLIATLFILVLLMTACAKEQQPEPASPLTEDVEEGIGDIEDLDSELDMGELEELDKDLDSLTW